MVLCFVKKGYSTRTPSISGKKVGRKHRQTKRYAWAKCNIMAVDIRKMFSTDLPAGLVKHSADALQIGGKFQINITGDGGGEWHVDVSPSGPKVEEGWPEGADCTITIENVDFQHLMDDPDHNTVSLFFAGRLRASGSQTLVMKIGKLMKFATL